MTVGDRRRNRSATTKSQRGVTIETSRCSPDCARNEVWARRPLWARRKVERRESCRHEGIHSSARERHSGTAASPKAEHERVGVESTLSAQEAFRAERTRILINLRVIRDLPLTFWRCGSIGARTRQVRDEDSPEIAHDQRAFGNEIVPVPVVLSRRMRNS